VSRPIVAGSQGGLLDAAGTIYLHGFWRSHIRSCRGDVPFAAPDDVIGEANLFCGLSTNWVVATPELVMGMAGDLSCIID
jgi:hypothetical protein